MNIFKNAYFGKPYKTRDERKAIYSYCIKGKPNEHFLIVDKNSSLLGGYGDDGISNACGYHNPNLDIVSEWTEEINEEELEKLAETEANNTVGEWRYGSTDLSKWYGFKEGFKSCYRKLKNL